jgi:hypothetical protein
MGVIADQGLAAIQRLLGTVVSTLPLAAIYYGVLARHTAKVPTLPGTEAHMDCCRALVVRYRSAALCDDPSRD